MRIINAKAEILRPDLSPESINAIYRNIEIAGRTCYKSEDKITSDSSRKFVRALVKSGHEAMIEHATMTVRFTIDRGISHEIVRHRIASYAQESSRYCSYDKDKFGKEITVILPVFFNDISEERREEIHKIVKEKQVWEPTDHESAYCSWYMCCAGCEKAYFNMLNHGCTAEKARSVLPNSLKTELVVTMNMRSWRHFFKLRAAGTTGAPHPQMLEVSIPLLKQCQELMPELFDDIIIKGE